MKIGVIGGVTSTLQVLNALLRHQLPVAHVYGYSPGPAKIVSGYVNLQEVCNKNGVPFTAFTRINDHAQNISHKNFDVLFVVGLSQLVSDDIVNGVKLGCVGFHPTALPAGRGRAPIAWLVLNETEGAASFFQIEAGAPADSGPILAQSIFPIDSEKDTAASIEARMLEHIDLALNSWLPDLKKGIWQPIQQQHDNATEYGVRRPEEGFVNWATPYTSIHRLIRASLPPHPGAFAFLGHEKIRILESAPETELKIQGVIGRVLKSFDNRHLIQCSPGALWIVTDYPLKAGMQLGVGSPYELFCLNQRLAKIEALIASKQI